VAGDRANRQADDRGADKDPGGLVEQSRGMGCPHHQPHTSGATRRTQAASTARHRRLVAGHEWSTSCRKGIQPGAHLEYRSRQRQSRHATARRPVAHLDAPLRRGSQGSMAATDCSSRGHQNHVGQPNGPGGAEWTASLPGVRDPRGLARSGHEARRRVASQLPAHPYICRGCASNTPYASTGSGLILCFREVGRGDAALSFVTLRASVIRRVVRQPIRKADSGWSRALYSARL